MPRPETAVALDRYFVRSRGKEGRDDNPLNDVRMIANPITRAADPARSVLKYRIGDKLSLTSNGFARLSIAFLCRDRTEYVTAWRQTRRVPARAAPIPGKWNVAPRH
jgi:hypothetical protein